MYTLQEIKELLEEYYDESEILDVLEISVQEVLQAFPEKLAKFNPQHSLEIEDEDNES
jgi:hypothetical protein